ncbi:mechanosensitive ion channel family protein [Bifidobacterium xylocopae]|uniref:Transporter n=1 Tax=Bifidobacterium xylocopae TaxID=2493119 RepID=A0A366KF73_9BIFI|nr:mechanosensitive ion channel family protein [Bifidobacterium xylocopae]RBP99882.1 transporter [Bifidobacterium xylocopae]
MAEIWLRHNSGRIFLLIVVVLCAAVASRFVSVIMRRTLERTVIPSASIFVNIVKAVIWIFAAACVLQPVFGINPTTVATALGVSGLALSLGLKDTIANIVGGFGLMLSKVIQPGDIISIQGITGTVTDITWRHTIVQDRAGNAMWIPNSVLNTTALEKIPAAGEAVATVAFTVKGGEDLDRCAKAITKAVQAATGHMMMAGNPPIVQFQGFSPYGISGQVIMFAKKGVVAATMQDAATRALSGEPYLVQDPALTAGSQAA